MSTQEEHPIDDLFRRTLSQADIDPPAAVWEGVLRTRSGRSGGAAWWSRHWPWGLLLIALVVGATLMINSPNDELPTRGQPGIAEHTTTDQGMASAEEQAEISIPTNDARSTSDLASTEQHETMFTSGAIPSDASTPHRSSQPPPIEGSAGGVSPTLEDTRLDPEKVFAVDDEPLMAEAVVRKYQSAVVHVVPGTGGMNEVHNDMRASLNEPVAKIMEDPLERKDLVARSILDPIVQGTSATSSLTDPGPASYITPAPIHFDHPVVLAGPTSSDVEHHYVLPRGQWWVGVQTGYYDTGRRWRGSDELLTEALNDLEVPTTTLGWGAVVGHTRNNGWGISGGVMFERSEQSFSHVDRKVEVEQEFITYLVTLNSQVFVSDVDTITTILVDERTTNGSTTLSVMRIPLEAHWHRNVRRWSWGLRAGTALEFTRARGVPPLVRDATDGRIVAQTISDDEVRRRHPAQILGTVGADLGYTIHERWKLFASPGYMIGLIPLTNADPISLLGGRWGVQVRVVHEFKSFGRR